MLIKCEDGRWVDTSSLNLIASSKWWERDDSRWCELYFAPKSQQFVLVRRTNWQYERDTAELIDIKDAASFVAEYANNEERKEFEKLAGKTLCELLDFIQ
jgi:hypothetical protein